jgi:glycosyltransferase involved in cell wall biosynthesis
MEKVKISACLVVYNEEKVIRNCLESIRGLVDEIIVVHDGDCSDSTLLIAREYTDKVFVRPHVGMMEGHLPFAFEKAGGEWLLRIDADEFLEAKDFDTIREKLSDPSCGGVICRWEFWNGKVPVYFRGLQKMCFMRKDVFHYCGIPHESGVIDTRVDRIPVVLHHRPSYNNLSWVSFLRKMRKWVPVHAQYYFPENIKFNCFNSDPNDWIILTKKVKDNLFYYILFEPLKMLIGQLKNGLFLSWTGWVVSLQQYVYYFDLYWSVWQEQKRIKTSK